MDNKIPCWWLEETSLFEPWAYAEVFTSDECDRIKEYCETLDLEDAHINENSVNHDIRRNKVAWLDTKDDTCKWVYETMTRVVSDINKQIWEFDLHYIENIQYTKYSEVGDKYNPHIDTMYNNLCRKLSFSVQLDDSDAYEGSNLLIHHAVTPIKGIRKKGTINFFPSFMLHNVTPLESGERNALVGWVCGPKFK